MLNQIEYGYTGKTYGYATPVTIEKDGKKYSFPFEYGTESCDRVNAIVPDAAQQMISWWESTGNISVVETESFCIYSVPVSLMVWMNQQKLHSTDLMIGEKIMRDMIKKIEAVKGVSHMGTNVIRVRLLSAKSKDKSIFSKYSYTETKNWQVYPYDYFRLDFRVEFTMDCPDINLSPAEC